ncbi:MAG: hypothetical protein IPO27_03810 [Bacteroidetes bacterium]|nr:hypothetical protein [Bacteroidota bacterium]
MNIKIKIFSISTLLIVLTNLNIKAQVYRNAIAAETTIPSINNVVNTGCDVRNAPAGEINSAFVWDGPNASLQIYVENCAGSAINLTAMIALPVGATDPDVAICNNNAGSANPIYVVVYNLNGNAGIKLYQKTYFGICTGLGINDITGNPVYANAVNLITSSNSSSTIKIDCNNWGQLAIVWESNGVIKSIGGVFNAGPSTITFATAISDFPTFGSFQSATQPDVSVFGRNNNFNANTTLNYTYVSNTGSIVLHLVRFASIYTAPNTINVPTLTTFSGAAPGSPLESGQFYQTEAVEVDNLAGTWSYSLPRIASNQGGTGNNADQNEYTAVFEALENTTGYSNIIGVSCVLDNGLTGTLGDYQIQSNCYTDGSQVIHATALPTQIQDVNTQTQYNYMPVVTYNRKNTNIIIGWNIEYAPPMYNFPNVSSLPIVIYASPLQACYFPSYSLGWVDQPTCMGINAFGYQLNYLGVPTTPSAFQNALSVSSKGINTNITYMYFDGINGTIKYKDVGFQAPNLKMESNESSANISIEPTLILDRCNINLSDGVEHLTLYNIQGAVINTFTYMQTRELESIITKLTPGLYMLNGKFESGVLLSTKFIKQ